MTFNINNQLSLILVIFILNKNYAKRRVKESI